jgi:hypothetical protein
METPRQQANVDESQRSRTGFESRSGQNTRRATGPRTAAGKRRSRYNAVKTGIFAQDLLLKNESRAAYDLPLRGYHERFRPEGMDEMDLVENLAVIAWRKRRLFRAERAPIGDELA